MFLLLTKSKTLLKTPFQLLIIIIFLNTSCSHEDFSSDSDNLSQDDFEINESIQGAKPIVFSTNNNANDLISRVHFSNTVISPQIENLEDDQSMMQKNSYGDYTVIATIDNPIVNGIELSGTSVE